METSHRCATNSSCGLLGRLFLAGSLLGMALGLPTTARACLCSGPETVEQAVLDSEAVFTGRVVSSTTHMPGGVRAVRFQVKEAFKGVTQSEVWVATPLGSGACAYRGFAPHKDFLVFARNFPEGSGYAPKVTDRMFFTQACSGTKPLSDSHADVKALGEAQLRFPVSWRPPAESEFLEVTIDRGHGVIFRSDLRIDRSSVEIRDIFDQPLLLYISLTDNVEMLEQALSMGANPNGAGPFGETPLMIAASGGNLEMVKTLVRAGAEISRSSDGLPPALMGSHVTALSFAADQGHARIVSYLLGQGAKIEGAAKADRSPLLIAVESEQPEVVEVLLQEGASLAGKHGSGEDLLRRVDRRMANGLKIEKLLQQALEDADP